jgi:hypothetical protein
MADLNKDLKELHAEVVSAVRERISNGGSNDDLRVALQLLKQNSVTANLSEDDTAALRSRMAGKLDFSALKDKPKVVPLRQDNQLSA